MASKRIAVLASGRGSDFQSLLDARKQGLLRSEFVLLASDQPGAKALARAEAAGVPTQAVPVDASVPQARRREEQEQRLVAAIEESHAELVVLAGYMRILTPAFVDRFADRIINIHPALLPAFPGVKGPKQALEHGVQIAGCTTHFVDHEVDHGPIILQAAVAVKPTDTETDLARRILAVEHQLLPRTINLYEDDRIHLNDGRVTIEPGDSWRDALPQLPGVLYGPHY